MKNKKLKEINSDIVLKVATYLAEKRGYTTTLDVKNILRKHGFFALQKDVSETMEDIFYENENWDYYFNGQFRIYFDIENIFQFDFEGSFCLN